VATASTMEVFAGKMARNAVTELPKSSIVRPSCDLHSFS
jgi:hypothetical protein